MRWKPDPRQLDLFRWAATRPTAIILDLTSALSRRICAERGRPAEQRNGTVSPLPRRPEDRRRA